MKTCLIISFGLLSFVLSLNQIDASASPTPLVSYGSLAPLGERPYQVFLTDGLQNCGGVIISQNWVVSAAHCVKNPNQYDYQIFAGSISKFEGYRHYVDKIIRHPHYNLRGNYENDIALLHVSTPFQLDNFSLRKIEMPDQNEMTFMDSIGTVSGWGMTEYRQDPNRLLLAHVPILSKIRCERILRQKGYTFGNGLICAGHEDERPNFCHGDSGGPLTVGNRLVGIVSWFSGRCGIFNAHLPLIPGVYTEIAYFRNWIRYNTGV